MPRIAMATSAVERIADSDDEASTTRVDDLIQRGRSQGHLSLAELRTAFDQAGLTPAEGRSILRELSEAGVRLANELAQTGSAETKGGPKSRAARSAAATTRAAKEADVVDPEPDPNDDADIDLADADVVSMEAESAALSDADKLTEVDLDDQTPAMGDSVHNYLKSIGRRSRLPVDVLEMLSKLSRVGRDTHQRLGREPTPEELAVELDRTPDQIEELLRTSRQPISLDSTIGEDGETSIGDLIEDVDAPEASELVDRQLMAEQLRSALDALTPREATIMAMRFGLYDGNPHTLDEIGRALGLTRERIRQLEKQSLSKLRHPSRAQPLLDYAS